jgi:signal transduction histidine kinase
MQSASELEVLQQACLESNSRTANGVESTIRWVRVVLGLKDSSVRLLIPDKAGRLRQARRARKPSGGSRSRSAEVRVAFETQAFRRVPLDEPGSELAIFPLVFEGRSIGVLEVEGPSERIASHRPTLEALAALAATLLGNVRKTRGEHNRPEKRIEPAPHDLELSVAWAAHELRGPLLAAKAGVDRALTAANARERRDMLRQSSDELAALAAFIDPLLSWGAGVGVLHLGLTDLTREVRAAVESLVVEDPTALQVNAGANVNVRVDRQEIRRAIANVVENATKYASPGTPIEISIDQDDGVATVRIVNQGPAVRSARRRSIFEPFVRDLSTGRSGSGLGLFIAHRIVQAHGGVIRVGSSAGWTAFVIELPAASRATGGVSNSGSNRR